MSQSTPLNQLQKPQQEPMQPSEPSIEEMLQDMDVPQPPPGNMNTEQFNYSIDQSQVPPKKQENFLNNTTNPPEPVPQPEANKVEKKTTIPYLNIELDSGGMVSKCMNAGKSALVVLVLVFLISLPEVNRMVFTKIPGMLSESGEIKIQGVGLKAVVCAILFMVINMFL